MAEFGIVPAGAINDPEVTDNRLRWLTRLSLYADTNGYCFPSIGRMAKEYGVSKAAVSKTFRELEEIGWLKIIPQAREDGSQTSNAYYILRHKHGKRPEVNGGQPSSIGGVNSQRLTGGQPPEVNPLTDHINRPINNNNIPPNETDNNDYPPEFEEFWEHYPRKIEKRATFSKWKTRIKEGIKPDILSLASRNYSDYCIGREPKFVKHGATFLGPNKHYEDFTKGLPEDRASPDFDFLIPMGDGR